MRFYEVTLFYFVESATGSYNFSLESVCSGWGNQTESNSVCRTSWLRLDSGPNLAQEEMSFGTVPLASGKLLDFSPPKQIKAYGSSSLRSSLMPCFPGQCGPPSAETPSKALFACVCACTILLVPVSINLRKKISVTIPAASRVVRLAMLKCVVWRGTVFTRH